MKKVQYDHFGGIEVLQVRTVGRPAAMAGRVLVKVMAAGINPGEATIRKGLLNERWPSTFPSGEGSDLAGVVVEVGGGVTKFRLSDEVFGFSNERCSPAEYASVPTEQLALKPAGVTWQVAGALYVAGATAYASVRAVGLSRGDTVAVSGAAGGVGTIGVQLAKRTGATVIGIASPDNDAWLTSHGVIPVNYGDGLARRLKAAAPSGHIHAFLDFYGGGYVVLAVAELGIDPQRINSIIDFEAAEKYKTQSKGGADAANAGVLAELADLISSGKLEVPIAKVYPLADVQQAYRELEKRHTRGTIVLEP